MNCPECGLPPECRECKSADREIVRLNARINDEIDTIRELKTQVALMADENGRLTRHLARAENMRKSAETRATISYQEGLESAKDQIHGSIEILRDYIQLISDMMAGTERHPALEANRLRRKVEHLIRQNA